MVKSIGGANPYLHALSRCALPVHREAYGALPVIVRREVSMPEELRELHDMLRQIGPEQKPFDRVATRFFDYGIPEEKITREVVDPLAAVVAQAQRTWYLSSVVNAGLLTDHPIDEVMAAVAALTQDGAKPVVSTGKFIDGAARAYARHLGIGGGGGGGSRKSLEGEPIRDTLARMHEIAAKCEHGLIRWQ